MINDRESNLVNVAGQIERFKSSLVRRIKAFFLLSPTLDETDREELEEIRSRIELIEINQSAIFLAHQTLSTDEKLTQEDLVERDKAIHIAKLNYTYQQIQQLRNDMMNPGGIYYHITQKHRELFKKMMPVLEKMLQVLETGRKNVNDDKLHLSARETGIFKSKNSLYGTANIIRGRYYHFNQAYDPLALTNSEGSCYGYVASWAEQIATGEAEIDFLRPNRETREKQINQLHYRATIEEKKAAFLAQSGTYLHTVEELLQKMDGNLVYGVNINSPLSGHRIGIRKIVSTGEIECYDPNFGVFAFKNESAFKTWFIVLLNHYNLTGSINISLQKIGIQKLEACSFVPPTTLQNMKDPTLFLPIIKSTDSNDTCKIKLNEFQQNIQFAGIGMLQGSIEEENNYIIQQRLSHQENAYKSYLKKFLFSNEEIEIISPPEADSHFTLKREIFKAIDQLMATTPSQNLREFLNTLREQIEKASQTISLEILISHGLSQKQAGRETTWTEALAANDKECITNLSKNFEISPIILTLLQQNLLLEIATVSAFFPNSKKYQEVNQVIKKYLLGTLTLTETFSYLKKITNQVQVGFFAILLSNEKIAAGNLHQLLRNIDPSNPSSIAQARARIGRFPRKPPGPSSELPKLAA